ncbi:MAG: hypothetical protein M1835_006075 [Candelina submexicana]|nr:MAG: hypothetical protein M1835_006075 [Candelina submexicana]
MEPVSDVHSAPGGDSIESGPLPVFDENLLANLTKKLEQGLRKPSKGSGIVKKGNQASESCTKSTNGDRSTNTSRGGDGLKRNKKTRQGSVKGVQHEPQTSKQLLAAKGLKKDSLSKIKAVPPKKDSLQLICEPRPDWHAVELPALAAYTKDTAEPTSQLLERVHRHARSLLEAENRNYASSHLASSSTQRFLSAIMSSGTLSDKVSALTLVVQQSPLHTMKALENLLGLAKKRSRAQAISALGALKDLFGQGAVLPSTRKLRAFAHQPGLVTAFSQGHDTWMAGDALPSQLVDTHLIIWAYEDWLKGAYFDLLRILEGWCNDEIEYARGKAITYVWELLKEKPEQESNLLRLLTNKLGDPDKKIASKTSFLLLQLQITHPLMKPVIVSSIEADILFRPGQSPYAKYYAITTLNQTILSAKEENLATRLLEIYFSLFVGLIKEPKASRRIGTGADGTKTNRKGQIQGGGGSVGRKAMNKVSLEERAATSREEMNDKMISAILTGVNRAVPFSHMNSTTFQQHMDTLFRITHSSNFNTSVQALILIQQLSGTKQVSTDRYYRTLYESLLDHRLLHSSKQPMYLNLVFKSLTSDLNVRRVKAFVKRLLQIVSLHQPPFICGVLYLVKKLEELFPGLKTMVHDPEQKDNEDEEAFKDAPDDMVQSPRDVPETHDEQSADPHNPLQYDGRKRDPEHSNADRSCLWETIPLLGHFHPSVVLFASSLIHQGSMPAKPDLSLHTLIHFLDRFVYRNAKSNAGGPRGSSIMQPLAGEGSRGLLLSTRQSGKLRPSVNSEVFWSKRGEEVAPDEVFFHDYFNQIGKGKRAVQKTKLEKTTESTEETGEAEDEDEIWKALVESRPELEGSDEGDSYMEMEALDSDDGLSNSDEIGSLEQDDVHHDKGGHSSEDILDGFNAAGDGDAILDSDDEVPSDLEKSFMDELEKQPGTSKAQPREEAARKRRKLKHLPTFASVDDYAEMLAEDDNGQDNR